MASCPDLTIKVKIVGIGGPRRLRFLRFIAKIMGAKLELQLDNTYEQGVIDGWVTRVSINDE